MLTRSENQEKGEGKNFKIIKPWINKNKIWQFKITKSKANLNLNYMTFPTSCWCGLWVCCFAWSVPLIIAYQLVLYCCCMLLSYASYAGGLEVGTGWLQVGLWTWSEVNLFELGPEIWVWIFLTRSESSLGLTKSLSSAAGLIWAPFSPLSLSPLDLFYFLLLSHLSLPLPSLSVPPQSPPSLSVSISLSILS